MFTIQASEGRQGLHRYFTGSVPVGELQHVVVFPDQLEDLDDDQVMQRGLAKTRVKDLVRYLTEAEDHFFSAVTLIILPRDLDRPAVEGSTDGDDDADADYYFARFDKTRPGRQRQGLLHLSGDVILFPGDGQHRLSGEFDALKIKPELAREELPVVLIPYESAEQVRQLFSDLNLNAKPPNKTIGYDFETRNPVALLAKRVAGNVRLFDGRVNRVSSSLPKSSRNVITLNTIVQGTNDILGGLAAAAKASDGREYLRTNRQASDEVIDVWGQIIDAFAAEWAPVLADEDRAAGELREEYVFPHGLGWQALARAASKLIAAHGKDDGMRRFRKAVQTFDWRRTATSWDGNAVIHDRAKGTNRVNNTGPAVAQMADTIVQAS